MLVDSQGLPLKATVAPQKRKPLARLEGRGIGGASRWPYHAAAIETPEMVDWLPIVRGPDAEYNLHRDRIVARSRDLARNDAWVSGGLTTLLDNIIGPALRPLSKPDYRGLAHMTSNAAFDENWADEFRRAAEAMWRRFSENHGHYNDVTRSMTVGQQQRLQLRHKLLDGESLTIKYWLKERVAPGAAEFATAFLVVDPDRLSNPYEMIDSAHMRGGVELDDLGVPIAYHIRKAEQNAWYDAIESMTWERVTREADDGWLRVIHDFDRDRADQHRGLGVFTPIMAHAKMLAAYYGVELQAARLAASLATYITSPYDPGQVEEAMNAGPDGETELSTYQEMRADWAEENPTTFNGVRIARLAMGEKIEQVAAAHPHSGFQPFAHEMLRMYAAALGASAEQITHDWSESNYSSARGAIVESWKMIGRRKKQFADGTAHPMFAAIMEEAMDRGDFDTVLPRNAPAFGEAAMAYSRCEWLGPARGWVDPVKEPQGDTLAIDAGLKTLAQACAENGQDWEEVIAQRAIEIRKFKELGIPLPSWAGMLTATEASRPEPKPEAE